MDKLFENIEEEIRKISERECEGCHRLLENQQGHDCQMKLKEEKILAFYNEAFDMIIKNKENVEIMKKFIKIKMLSKCDGWSRTRAKSVVEISNEESNPINIPCDEEENETV